MGLYKLTLEHVREHHRANVEVIRTRLNEFASVKQHDWFYEFCYCLLTPQSKADHANTVVSHLKNQQFKDVGNDPTVLLSSKNHYIRFHNVKANRLQTLRLLWPEVERLLLKGLGSKSVTPWETRNDLCRLVSGYGMKEASHVLRNIGWRHLAILDRHILRSMVQLNVYADFPTINTMHKYVRIEEEYLAFAGRIDIDPDELDLTFWSMNTGFVLK